ncbi:MAG: hypothetical protein ACO3O3_08675 [Ilumatobacteraceae bacterium]
MNDNTITGLLAFVYTLLSKFDLPSEVRTMVRETLIGAIAAAVNSDVTSWEHIQWAVDAKTISGDDMKPNSAAAMRSNVNLGIQLQQKKQLGTAICKVAGVKLSLSAVQKCKYEPRASSRRQDLILKAFESMLSGSVQQAASSSSTLI